MSRRLLYRLGMMSKQYHYHITIKGRLDSQWQDWFDGSTIKPTADGNTVLNSGAIDQAALHALFKKIRNLGLTIITVDAQAQGG